MQLEKFKEIAIKIISNIFLWTLIITIFIVLLLPELFNKYNANLLYIEQSDIHINHNDLDNNGEIEKIGLRAYQNYFYLEIHNNENFYIGQYLLENCEEVVKTLWINDYDNNGYKEIYFFTIKKDSLFLNIFNAKDMQFLKKDVFITNVYKNRTGVYDVYSINVLPFHDRNKDGFLEFYFFISANFSYYPRGVFAYDIKNNTLHKSEYVGAHLHAKTIIDTKSQEFIPLSTFATSNFRSEFSHIPYPDTTGWLMVLNTDLDFIFHPIEFEGNGNNVSPYIFQTKDDVFIIALNTNNQKECFKLVKYDLDGNLIEERLLAFKRKHNKVILMDLYHNNEPGVIKLLSNDGYVYVYNENLELINDYMLTGLKHNNEIAFWECDINNDARFENIIVHDKGIDIFTNDFSNKTFLPMNNPGFYDHSIIHQDENTVHMKIRNSRLNVWYIFEYKKNVYYQYRFLLYIGIYLSVLLILFLIFQIRVKKLKSDNLKLQKIIDDNVRDLKMQNKKILELGEFKDGLISMIVHDLKNPLNIIMNSNNIKTITETARGMNLLVMNILDVQKMENIQIKLNLKNIHLQQVINSAINNVKYLLEQKSLKLNVNIYSGIFVIADQGLLERVFTNLLTNAIKFSPNNEEIIIENEILDDFVKITITDKGMGIPKDKLKTVFEKFSQVETRNIGRLKSTGIGLNFCKLAVEAHKGQIGVTSEEKKKTSFWITLKMGTKEKSGHDIIFSKKIADTKTHEISQKDYEFLLPFAKELEKLEMYEYSNIMNIIEQMKSEKSANVQQWLSELEKAVKSSDEEKYLNLISSIRNAKT